MVTNGASSRKTNYIDILSEILNLEGHLNHSIGSKVTASDYAELVNFAYWWSCIAISRYQEGSALQQACF